jgi:hypothetical protein
LVLVEETVASMWATVFFYPKAISPLHWAFITHQNNLKQPMPDSTLNELLEFIESEELVLLAYDHIQESPEPALWN